MTTAPAPKAKRVRLAGNQDLLKKLVSILEKEKLTKAELAEKLGLASANKLTDSVLLAAVKFAGNSKFLDNMVEKKAGGRVRKSPKFVEKTGLHIQPWQFEGRSVAEGQRYEVSFGRKGIITLRPTSDEDVDGGDE